MVESQKVYEHVFKMNTLEFFKNGDKNADAPGKEPLTEKGKGHMFWALFCITKSTEQNHVSSSSSGIDLGCAEAALAGFTVPVSRPALPLCTSCL